LREIMARYGVKVTVVEPGVDTTSSDITEAVFKTLHRVHGLVALASKSYGELTANPACTFYEVREWEKMCAADPSKPRIMAVRTTSHNKPFAKKAICARELFSAKKNEIWTSWDPRSPDCVPDEVVKMILDRFCLQGHLPSCPKLNQHRACTCGRGALHSLWQRRAAARLACKETAKVRRGTRKARKFAKKAAKVRWFWRRGK
jgi:hypothetical protein